MDDLSAIRRDLFPPLPSVSATTTTPPTPSSTPSAMTIERATHSLPALDPGAIAAAHAHARVAAMTARIDAYLDAAHASYAIELPDGTAVEVRAPPQFRMVGGANYRSEVLIDPNTKQPVRDAAGNVVRVCVDDVLLKKALGPSAFELTGEMGRVIAGRGTPEDVRRVTRALIERGHLGPVDPKNPAAAIQALQWRFGVGIDCSGYVQRAFFAVRGRTGTASERAALGLAGRVVDENFSGLPRNPAWKSVPITDARPGDIMVLDRPKKGDVGHKVLVRSNAVLSASEHAKMGLDRSAFAGPVRKVEVDSSWGAGANGTGGGVQRRTCLYDETTKQWASWDPVSRKATFSTMSGPYDHPLVGIYRPKSEP